MRSTFATLAIVGAAAAQGVAGNVAPSTSAPAGCQVNYPGTFTIEVVNVTTTGKRDLEARDTPVTIKLQNGVFTDAQGRIGSVVANGQIQFDGPPAQAGAKYTAGWSVCQNGTVALGSQVVFYQCLSGGFYNLYDHSLGGQCGPIYIQAVGSSSNAGQIPDGQVTAGRPATQISDGQIQATTGAGRVTQIGDGQIQAPTGAKVTQIGDGQIQAPTGGAKVTQIGDGQIQAPTGRPVTQISDGQIQAPKTTGRPVTQISDGQIQAPKTTPTAAPTRPANGTAPTTTSKGPIAATGAAVANAVGAFGIFAGAVAVALL
ncbi:uncharacterized protein K489DRAFT_376722 [Dissoconium aciculare CBS 342.82]|jgi:hypothetical protein|uniref:Cell wall mannoprotein PIR1-like C-terminal domain-containing protein n=1 Tax=Dissoconium aciculare CBS 342.82 TaxID=1314786 RepID=A0A6J3ME88_9PEZI|nr:uncharacterized protein K489DRAFT_376722 [Dissoconium aciculare CBS 342.82]KAF1826320.1 hypothetical protein K489DRAFT_376722 [Dissoconium aciculare CBS 342.82]